MRIRNLRSFQFFYGYAGPDNKGWSLKPNQLSPELPTRRFYDKKLQKDWQAQRIEIVLNACDRAILGDDARDIGVVQAVAPQPAVAAADVAAVPAPTDAAAASADDSTVFLGVDWAADAAVTAASEAEPAAAQESTDPDSGITKCSKCERTNYLQLDPRVGAVLCRYCRSAVSKRITETLFAPAVQQNAPPIVPIVGAAEPTPATPPLVAEAIAASEPEEAPKSPEPEPSRAPDSRLVEVKLPTGETVTVTPESAASLRYSVNARVTQKPTASVDSFFSGLEVK